MSASEHISDEQATFAQAIRQPSTAPALGQKLRAAREKLGFSAEDVSQAIRVQSSAVRHMEAGDFDALGPTVFAKGFLRSYAKHVQLGQAWLDDELATLALDSAPILLPSRGERQERSSTAERGMLAASYLVGTAILVSAIFVVTHFDRFVGTRAEQAPLVSAPQIPAAESRLGVTSQANESRLGVTSQANESRLGVPSQANGSTTPLETAAVITYPAATSGAPSVLNPAVSDTPDSSQAQTSIQNAPSAVAAGLVTLPNLPADSQALELTARGTVWVEISDSTGRRLEFNNLSNGVRKSYSGKAPFALKIGNAAYASLIAGGEAIDLSAFTNGSIAKLNLIESNGSLVATATATNAAAISTTIETQNPEQ